MSATGNHIKEIEQSWYSKRPGLTFTQSTPINEMKRVFYATTLGVTNNQIPLEELEWRWLKSLTGVTGKYIGDMWREAVAGSGATPTNSLTENKIIYYRKVA